MQRITMLLVYAVMLVGYGHATPYSRISDQQPDIYSQYSDKHLGVNTAPAGIAQSHSSANSNGFNSYASSSSSSSSYSTNVHPEYPYSSDINSQFSNARNQQQQSVHSSKSDNGGQEYWWMNANSSPFKPNKQSSNSGAGVIVGINKVSANQGGHDSHSGQSDVNIQGNPFLQGNINSGSTHSKNKNDISKNPFFNGATSSGASSSVSSSTANVNTATNQFQQKYDKKIQQIEQKSESKYNNGNYGESFHQGNVGGGLSVSCSGRGKICVPKYQCVNGYVSGSVQGLTQVKSDNQQCDINNEVCCTLKNGGISSNTDQEVAGSYDSSSHLNSQEYHNENNGLFGSSNGGIFGHSNSGNGGQHNVEIDDASNGYLPPIGSEPSSNVPAFSNPPQANFKPDYDPSPSGAIPTHVQLGCAAALICVEEQYCGMDGMISPTTLSLSEEQISRRMPLSDCKNPDSGIIGKCCRDPNYVDPWPTGNLPANYTGGFDEQGFPTFLNIQRTRPTKKPTGPPIKSGFSHVKNNPQVAVTSAPTERFGSRPTLLPQFPNLSNIPSQINQGFVNLLGGKPTTGSPHSNINHPSSIQNIIVTSTKKPFLNLPNFSNSPNSYNKNKYDESSSNTNPIVIAPHKLGVQCGVKNSAQQTTELNDPEVGFGEIPWEAMILSNREKKLLCSGAIISPNTVVTAARCVYGLNAKDVSIKAGEWKLGYELKHEEPLPFQIVQVASIIPHPGYQSNYPSHDLAVLLLNDSVVFDYHIGTICVGEPIKQSQTLIGRKCISTGWGKHVLQAHLAGAIMHSIDVDVINENECQQRLINAETQIEADNTLICTKAHRQNNNMCQVDLGGPLACDRGDGIYEIIGVYNQDTGCIPTNQVATFALIDNPWIEYVLANPPKIEIGLHAPVETSSRNVAYEQHRQNVPCDCQKSNLSPEDNQYLPPV